MVFFTVFLANAVENFLKILNNFSKYEFIKEDAKCISNILNLAMVKKKCLT